jgi:YD repeat-containing protein
MKVTDPLTQQKLYERDPFGQVTKVTDENGHFSTITYDADGYGNVIATTDPLGKTTRYQWDAVGNLLKITNPSGFSTRATYDDANRLLAIYEPYDGTEYKTNAFVYDEADRLIETNDYGKGTTPRVKKYTYEKGLLKKTIESPGSGALVTECEYDDFRRLWHLKRANGKFLTYAYDIMDRLIETRDQKNAVTLQNHYDQAGNVVESIDGKGQNKKYIYDALNRVSRINYPDNTSVAYTFDQLGRRATMTDSTGITTYTYDDLSRLKNVRYPNGKTIGYQYDKVGNLRFLTDAYPKTTQYIYDAADRMTSSVRDGKTVKFSFDDNGNMTGVQFPGGFKQNFSYSSNNLMKQTQYLNSRNQMQFYETYTHSGPGFNLTQKQYGEATGIRRETEDTSYNYDAYGHLTRSEVRTAMTWTFGRFSRTLRLGRRTSTTSYL